MKVRFLFEKTKIPQKNVVLIGGMIWKLRIGKLRLFFLLLMLPFLSSTVQAHEIDLPQDDIMLTEALHRLSQKYEVFFSYDETSIENVEVNYQPEKYNDVEHALDQLLVGTALKYKIFDNRYIILYEESKEALSSLKGMVRHLETVIDNQEKAVTSREALKPVALLQHSVNKQIEPLAFTVSGTVTDEAGEPLIGVNIQVKGTNKGTATDFEGNFTLDDIDENAVLVVSYVGYETQEVMVAGKSTLTVTMVSDSQLLDEVVVVGYGTQKKINLTGAVDQIGEKAFENRPMSNISRALQGSLANLNIDFTDGKPDRAPSYNIRGTTSIGQGGNALVLIDGVEGNPSLLNPNDIESVTILKDASSAAIYGSRGAFGVVLITTKTPEKEKLNITYSSNYTIRKLTEFPDFVSDGYVWASMFKEFYSAWYDYSSVPSVVNKGMSFSLDYLEELERRSKDPSLSRVEVSPTTGEYLYYDNTNWYQEMYKKNSFGHDQNLALSGGSEKAQFYLSGRYVDQPGIFKYNTDTYNMYNMRAKGILQLTPWLNVQNNISYSNMVYHEPIGSNELMIWRGVMYDAPPMSPLYNPDGSLTEASAYGLGSHIYGKNRLDTDRKSFTNRTDFTANITDKLRLKGDFSFQTSNRDELRLRIPVPYSKYESEISYIGGNTNNINKYGVNQTYIASNLFGEFESTINNHYLKVMIGANYEMSTTKSLTVFRNGLVYEDAENLNLALGQSYSINEGFSRWNIAGGFYRLNYSWKDRYLIELSGRYDGSSKFPSDERFAFFPSFSAGWRPIAETFWHVPDKFISNLKLRFSYGSLGNGNISPYAFNEKFNIYSNGRILDKGNRVLYTNSPGILPAGLTWETSTTTNFGIDMTVANNHLDIGGDIYVRKTTDMFTHGVTLPAIFGASSPYGNYADLETKGWELSLNWRDEFKSRSKPFSFNIRVNLSDYKAKILKYNNEEKRLSDHYPGKVLGEIWGFETAGFFESEEEVENWANQDNYKSSVSGQSLPGDIKLSDLNNDGVINIGKNTVDDPGDRKIIGNDLARYRFGLNLNLDWNNFFFTSFFQGVGRQDWYPDNNMATFWGMYVAQYADIPSFQLGNIWSEDNRDAYFPRERAYIALSHILRQPQTKYLQDAAYVRLKNLQIGYSLPKNITSNIKAERIRFYFSGENIWTYSPLYKLIGHHVDVENIRVSDITWGSGSGGGFNYPMTKSYSLGLEIMF